MTDAEDAASDYNTFMKFESLSRVTGVLACLAMLSGRAAAQSDGELAGAFGSMGASLAVMAQLKTQSQKPVVSTPSPTDSDWKKTLARVLKEGKCETDSGTALVTCQLEEVIGDPNRTLYTYNISITGRIGTSGVFETTGGRLVKVTSIVEPERERRRYSRSEVTIGADGMYVGGTSRRIIYMNDGTSKDFGDTVDDPKSPSADSFYRDLLTHWALAPLPTPSQSGRPVAAAPKASDTDWDKALAFVLTKGNCSTDPGTRIVVCELEDRTGDPKDRYDVYRIRVAGLTAADGTFKLKEVLLSRTQMIAQSGDGIAWRKIDDECGVDAAGKPVNSIQTKSYVMLDGTTKVLRSNPMSITMYGDIIIGHWAHRR